MSSLVAVTRTIPATSTPLRDTLQELLNIPHDYGGDPQLHNYWRGENLRVKSVTLSRGIAVIHISGDGPAVAGICDEPRIESQIIRTTRQFSSVKKVEVIVNGRTLKEAIR